MRTLAALTLTCWLAIALSRFLAKERTRMGAAVILRGGITLGKGRGVWLVEALGRSYLLGVTEHEIRVLAQEEIKDTVNAVNESEKPGAQFSDLLNTAGTALKDALSLVRNGRFLHGNHS